MSKEALDDYQYGFDRLYEQELWPFHAATDTLDRLHRLYSDALTMREKRTADAHYIKLRDAWGRG